jgi:dolichol-phosphate mannosyltransferase
MSIALSVIVPTRNERDNVPRLLDALRRALDGVDYELVFVDDSTDGTERVLGEVARVDARIVVHHREGGRGLASAVITGIGLCRADALAVIDADLQHPPDLLRAMLAKMTETSSDVVVASRFVPGAAMPGLGAGRRAVSQITRVLARTLLRGARRSTDPLAGYFMVRRAAVDGVTLQPIGFKILLEILVRGRVTRVADVPYVFEARVGGQSKASLRQGTELFRQMVALAASNPEDSRVWKFLLVGAMGVGIAVGSFWVLHNVFGVHYLVANPIAGAIATFTNFILNNAFTWADRRVFGASIFWQRMGKYYLTTGIGQGVSWGLLWALTHLGMIPMLANLIGVLIGGMMNYFVHNMWTWRHQSAG